MAGFEYGTPPATAGYVYTVPPAVTGFEYATPPATAGFELNPVNFTAAAGVIPYTPPYMGPTNKTVHAMNGNTASPTPAAAQAAITAALDHDGYSHGHARRAYADLLAAAGREAVNRIAVRPFADRIRELRAALARYKITVGGTAISSSAKGKSKGSAPPAAAGKGKGGPAAGPKKPQHPHVALPPQQLVGKPWSVPVRPTDAITRAAATDGGGVAWVSSATEAASLAQDLHGCDGALAIVTRRPIAKPKDGWGDGPTGYYPYESA
eukprot:gene17611-6597_t